MHEILLFSTYPFIVHLTNFTDKIGVLGFLAMLAGLRFIRCRGTARRALSREIQILAIQLILGCIDQQHDVKLYPRVLVRLNYYVLCQYRPY